MFATIFVYWAVFWSFQLVASNVLPQIEILDNPDQDLSFRNGELAPERKAAKVDPCALVVNFKTSVTFHCRYPPGLDYPLCRTELKACEERDSLMCDPCAPYRLRPTGFKCKSTSFKCICSAHPERGPMCVFERNPCDEAPCKNGGTCKTLNSTDFECKCPTTHTGKNCDVKINPCDKRPCENGGTCTKLNATEFVCTCPPNFIGKNCSSEINPCDKRPCENGGACTKLNATDFVCTCPPSFIGKNCRIEMNPCDKRPCENGGACNKLNGTEFVCTCPPSFIGKNCSIEINPCRTRPCQNGGSCNKLNATAFECLCRSNYTGPTCMDKINIPVTTENQPHTTESPSGIFNFWKVKSEKNEYTGGSFRNGSKNGLLHLFKFKHENVEFSNLDLGRSNKEDK